MAILILWISVQWARFWSFLIDLAEVMKGTHEKKPTSSTSTQEQGSSSSTPSIPPAPSSSSSSNSTGEEPPGEDEAPTFYVVGQCPAYAPKDLGGRDCVLMLGHGGRGYPFHVDSYGKKWQDP